MLSTRSLTLLFTLSLIFAIVFPVVDAHIDAAPARRNVPTTHRMLKKRAPLGLLGNDNAAAGAADSGAGVGNAAVNPAEAQPSSDSANGKTNTDTNTTPATSAKATPTNPATPTSSPTNTAATTNGGLVGGILSGVLGSSSSTTSSSTPSSSSSSSSSSSTTSFTSSSSSSTASSSSSSGTPTGTSATPTLAPENATAGPSLTTITTSSSASPTGSAAPNTSSGSVTKIQRNTIIILIAIGASIGAAGIIWTIIRKWKFRPSSSFEDRMQPIDWQPTTGSDRDITEKLGRQNSTGSQRSFVSGGAHGSTHDHLTADLPPHDFTAGPTHLAPGAGYADLQRGPSPQPDLHGVPNYRSPSPYQYDIPNPGVQHGAYYNGAAGYQGGYDHNRGY